MKYEDTIRRISQGDREAFNDLCRERYASMLSYARLFLKGDWAEDVIQDVLYGVWQNRANLDPESNLQGYLIRSVYNRCMSYLGSKNRMRYSVDALEARIDALVSDYYSPDRNPSILGLYNADLRQRLEAAIEKLTPRCREVFTMSYIDHYSEKEIGERLGLSLSTVENHMYAALKQLRSSLSEI